MTENIQTNAILPNLEVRTLSLVDNMKTEKGMIEGWDFPVHQEKTFLADGTPAIKQAVVATIDNVKTVIGDYVKQSLVPNVEVVESFEEVLDSLGFEWSDPNTEVTNNGARMRRLYHLTNMTQDQTLVHSPFEIGFALQNSYDGSCKVSASLFVRLLTCLNGLETDMQFADLSARHSPNLDLGFMSQRVSELMDAKDDYLKGFERMADYELTIAKATAFFGNVSIASKGKISKRLATRMLIAYLEPDQFEKDLPFTLWRAYMAGTRVLRDLRLKKPTSANAANQSFGQICYLAANPDISSYAKAAWAALNRPCDLLLLESAS